jgi:hypothetical protein
VSRPVSSLLLRLPRIEKKPKPVFQERWGDFAGALKSPTLAREFFTLVRGIENGRGVLEHNYRAGIDRVRDALLENQGIMHLHLGGRNSELLIFLIEYNHQVLLLESNTHTHFRTRPPGRNILAPTQSWLANLEREMAEVSLLLGQRTMPSSGKRRKHDGPRSRHLWRRSGRRSY